jgi:5-methylcytosine-specific restriction endonuclease McrA
MKLYNCAFPGCYTTVDAPRSYCKRHEAYGVQQAAKRIADAKAPRWAGAERPNSALYRSTKWTELSKRVRRERGECARCGAIEGLSVHHVNQPKGNMELFYDEGNLVVLCKECHDRMTSAENRKG